MNSHISARLPADTRNKLASLAKAKGRTRSDIIKESVDLYYSQEETELDSFMLGEPYFGKYSSGRKDASVSYKRRIKEKLRGQLDSY